MSLVQFYNIQFITLLSSKVIMLLFAVYMIADNSETYSRPFEVNAVEGLFYSFKPSQSAVTFDQENITIV